MPDPTLPIGDRDAAYRGIAATSPQPQDIAGPAAQAHYEAAFPMHPLPRIDPAHPLAYFDRGSADLMMGMIGGEGGERPGIGHNMPPEPIEPEVPVKSAQPAPKPKSKAAASRIPDQEIDMRFTNPPIRELEPYQPTEPAPARQTAVSPYPQDVIARRDRVLAQFDRAEKKRLASPNIGMGSRVPLFDMSNIETEWNPRAQFKLPRLLVPDTPLAKAQVRMIEQRMNDPQNLARIKHFLERGQELGGMYWYNTNPLRMAYLEELGTERGQAAWERFMDFVAATSTRSKVPQNIRSASYHQWREMTGRPPATWWPESPAEEAAGKRSVEVLPTPYGHVAQRNQMMNVRDIRGPTGTMDLYGNPKPPSFGENLKGNLAPATIDAHLARGLGLPEFEAPADYYGTIEGLFGQNVADPMGLTPAQAQSSLWLGAAEETGQLSGNEPFMGHMEDVVRRTAAVLGEDPRVTLRRFIRSGKPLLSIGLLSAGTAYALASDPAQAKEMPAWAQKATNGNRPTTNPQP